MDEPESDPAPQRRRRERYPGTHPRRFEQKYKELDSERYPDIAEHVKGRGQTPAGQHVPILLESVLAKLDPTPGERGVDCTLGWGGHAQRILERLQPGGSLLALDVDPIEIERSEARLRAACPPSVELSVRRTNFAGLARALGDVGWSDGVDFLLADLGVSSMQIDDPARGFSFKIDAPLDLRLNPRRKPSGAEWLASVGLEDLVLALRENADEPRAETIAQALLDRRGTIRTTFELAQAVRCALPGSLAEDERELAVRRVFQAVRIAVNGELEALDELLRQLPDALRPGGRAVFLTFHSGEDRRVKQALRAGLASGRFASISSEVERPSAEEQRANPRSSSAKLRWARKDRA
jgi:16S rRNA (cytosine1402-N4)-methyltransferase